MNEVGLCSRIQLKNILYATDFSPAAAAAVPYAAGLAKHYGSELYAMHVRPPAVNPMAPPESWGSLEEAAKILAEQERRKLLDMFVGIKPRVLIKEGDIWPHLAAAIDSNHIDLVVVGTRGRSGVRKFFLGSAAEEIFRQAPCPVLTVGPHSPAEPKQAGEITRILLATDFRLESTAAASYAISLAQEYQAYLTLLHVLAEPKAGDLVHPSDLAASYTQRLHYLVPPEAELWCVPDFVVERGDAADKILEIAAQRKSDLIVLGIHQPQGLPGAATHLPMATAHKVVSHANCPVLTVRA
jgi:nucleotide-binding universal stress UspA family protein